MARSEARIVLVVKTGRSWRTAMDVLDLVDEVLSVPTWLEREREELINRCATLLESVGMELEQANKRRL